MSEPLISIVIPIKNGGYWLDNLFRKLQQQTLAQQTEIIAIDSGSTDETLAIIGQFPVKLITIDPKTFNHGTTRNLGVRSARGKYVVMTVQDAVPIDDYWLEKLLSGFENDQIVAVCGQQIVPHDTGVNPVQWFRPVDEPSPKKYHFPRPEDFDSLTPAEKRAACGWDDVNAMYLREVLLRLPFREMVFAEDAQWAKDALLRGQAILYNYAARVAHYHHENADFAYKRMFTECYYMYRLFEYVQPRQDRMIRLLRAAKVLLREGQIGFSRKLKWWLYNYRLLAASDRAVRDFHACLEKGGNELDMKHMQICGVPPMASKPAEFI